MKKPKKKINVLAITKTSPDYPKYLVKFIKSKTGSVFTLDVLDQLIDHIQVDMKGNIIGIKVTTEKIVLDGGIILD